MSFIGTSTLFLMTLAFLQINGCFDQSTTESFNKIDLDQDGFVTHEEFCQRLKTKGISEDQHQEICDQAWNTFDLNHDDKLTCQGKSFV